MKRTAAKILKNFLDMRKQADKFGGIRVDVEDYTFQAAG
jgi:hypothetical protein